MEIFPLKQHHEQHFYSESHSQLSVLALKRSLEQQLVLGAAPIYVVPVGRSDPRRAGTAQRDPPGSQRLTFSRQAAPGAGTAVRWMTISCPPLCTSLSCSSTAMLRAVLTDTRWSSDQASGSNPLTPCCSRTAGSLLTAVSRNPALAAAAAASSTSESSPSGGSSSPAAGTDGLPPLSAAAILPPPHGRLARTARAPPLPPKAPRRCGAVPALPERGRLGAMEEDGPLLLNLGSAPRRVGARGTAPGPPGPSA